MTKVPSPDYVNPIGLVSAIIHAEKNSHDADYDLCLIDPRKKCCKDRRF